MAENAEKQAFDQGRLRAAKAKAYIRELDLGSLYDSLDYDRRPTSDTTRSNPETQSLNRQTIPSIPNGRLESPEQLQSLLDGMNIDMSAEQGQAYGKQLGEYLDRKMQEGSTMAFIVAFALATLLDFSDILLAWLEFSIPIVTTIARWSVEMIIYVAILLIIRRHISFFKRGLIRLLIRIIIIPAIVEIFPILGDISPTYMIMIIYVWHKYNKDLRMMKVSREQLNERMTNFSRHIKKLHRTHASRASARQANPT